MCWYARDLIMEWRRSFVPGEGAAMDPQDAAGHAPDPDRDMYFYRVAFVDSQGIVGHVVEGGNRFPGWRCALRTYMETIDMRTAMPEAADAADVGPFELL